MTPAWAIMRIGAFIMVSQPTLFGGLGQFLCYVLALLLVAKLSPTHLLLTLIDPGSMPNPDIFHKNHTLPYPVKPHNTPSEINRLILNTSTSLANPAGHRTNILIENHLSGPLAERAHFPLGRTLLILLFFL
jgi:hypothetical protein